MAQLGSTEIDILIGKRIQQKRKECGFSAEQLAELLDLSQQQLSRYERGTNKINVAHLVHIAHVLRTPISYFFDDCMRTAEWNHDELDVHWQMLSTTQKHALIHLIHTLQTQEKN